MMKIIYIANARIPTEKAHGLQIMKMCESFSLAGAEVQLILPNRKNSQQLDRVDPFAFYRIKKIFKIQKIKSVDPTFLVGLIAGTYIKFQTLFFSVGLFFYFLFQKDKSAAIFYTRDEHLLPLIQLFSSKVVWECHALPKNSKSYIRHAQKCFRLFVLTEALKSELVRLGVAAEKILVSPDAVDLEIFGVKLDTSEARSDLGLPLDKSIVGYTGSFKTKGMDKGIIDILKALKIIIGSSQEVIFVAVGGSKEDIEYYRALAQEQGVTDYAFFLPPVSQDKLAIYQQAFDLLLMPFPANQHYSMFMSPLKMFEYLAASKPIIASDLPSIREVLTEKEAVFVEPDNPESLAAGIIKCLKNQDLCANLSRQAFSKAKEFTWSKRAQKIIDFLS